MHDHDTNRVCVHIFTNRLTNSHYIEIHRFQLRGNYPRQRLSANSAPQQQLQSQRIMNLLYKTTTTIGITTCSSTKWTHHQVLPNWFLFRTGLVL